MATLVWTQLQGTTATVGVQPIVRRRHDMAWDSAHSKVVLTGGESFTNSPPEESWGWDGAAWGGAVASPTDRPSASLKGRCVAYDVARGEIVAFGGSDGFGALNDHTWVSGDGGATWTQRSPTHKPSPRSGAALAYCAAISKPVLFGGWTGGAGYSGQTWTWNGTDWTQESPVSSPAGREGDFCNFGTEYRDQVLVFGGATAFGVVSDETWVYTGSNWVQQTPAASPAARRQHSLAFHTTLDRAVLFGGYDGAETFGDTWTFQDGEWRRETPLTSPAARSSLALSEDGNLGSVILFGGDVGTLDDLQNDLWVLDVTAVSPTDAVGVYLPPSVAS